MRSHAAEWRQLLRRFLGAPELWVTRQTNVLLAALLIAVLMHFTATLTSSRTAGWLFAGTVATFPEFLVRGAYGGYFAATAFLSLLLLVELEEGAPPLRLGAASACAALSDQKGLLVPVAWVIAARAVGLARRFWPLAAALFGLLAFALWGLATDPSSFVSDFAQEHVIRRLSPTDVRLVSEAGKMYPSVVGLWREFAAHYGSLFTVALGVASICGLKSRRAAVRCAAVSVLIGAFVFSVTDWRQTKHLSLLVVPGVVAMSGLWPRSRARQYVALAVLGLMLVTNVVGSMKLLADFASIQPKPSW